MSASVQTESCLLARSVALRVVEIAAFDASSTAADSLGLPSRPGAVTGIDDGGSSLYFAPGRWLLVAPSPACEERIRAAAQWGSWVEVTGKWVAMTLQGPGAQRVLASTIDVEATLQDRECAAVTLFDCASILVRDELGFTVWVHASVASDWVAAVERLGAALTVTTG
jgi:glycine cleavage system aminomethyltransferase T